MTSFNWTKPITGSAFGPTSSMKPLALQPKAKKADATVYENTYRDKSKVCKIKKAEATVYENATRRAEPEKRKPTTTSEILRMMTPSVLDFDTPTTPTWKKRNRKKPRHQSPNRPSPQFHGNQQSHNPSPQFHGNPQSHHPSPQRHDASSLVSNRHHDRDRERSDRRRRHRSERDDESCLSKFVYKHVCGILYVCFSSIVIMALLAVIIYGYNVYCTKPDNATTTTMATVLLPSRTWYTFPEAVCLKKNNLDTRCVIGSAPDKNTCKLGWCSSFKYTLWKEANGKIFVKYESMHYQSEVPSKDLAGLLCEMADGQPGVCQGGECSVPYTGGGFGSNWKDEKRWDTGGKAELVDNCDEPNPCWNDPGLVREREARTVTREQCLSKRKVCMPGAHADLWVQHRRCKPGKHGATAEDGCTGQPWKVWKCGDCAPQQLPCSYAQDDSCKCTDSPSLMPDGAGCGGKRDEDGKYIMFCLSGDCVPAKELPAGVKNESECMREKKEDEKNGWL